MPSQGTAPFAFVPDDLMKFFQRRMRLVSWVERRPKGKIGLPISMYLMVEPRSAIHYLTFCLLCPSDRRPTWVHQPKLEYCSSVHSWYLVPDVGDRPTDRGKKEEYIKIKVATATRFFLQKKERKKRKIKIKVATVTRFFWKKRKKKNRKIKIKVATAIRFFATATRFFLQIPRAPNANGTNIRKDRSTLHNNTEQYQLEIPVHWLFFVVVSYL